MAQMEPDILPLRRYWLDEMHSIAKSSTAWVVGSPFLSLCAHNVQTGRCGGLGGSIKFHLNGNALYAVGDRSFRAYWKRAFEGELKLWPFDLALHKYLLRMPPQLQRELSPKYRASQMLLNYGGEVLPEGAIVSHLQRTAPRAFLLHSSWAFSLIRKSPLPAFHRLGIAVSEDNVSDALSPPAVAQLGAVESQVQKTTREVVLPRLLLPDEAEEGSLGSSVDERRGEGQLVELARRQAQGDSLILTFVTSAYDELCSNFVAHLGRAAISSYLLVTFNPGYRDQLVARRQPVYLHSLAELHGGGSDKFASHDFFLVNSARYSVLISLLRARVDVFAMDLDVVLLRDPRPFVSSLPYELMLQSDARNSVSQLEHSPFLLRDRLHLPSASGIAYVNGGVFFARGTYAVARLFEDTWSLVSEDLGSLNEQDCLNRMLMASNLRWAPLPPTLFPNGFVFFRRPLAPSAWPSKGPMLLHCNWINSIAAKRFLLREVQLWNAGWTAVKGRSSNHTSLEGSRPPPLDGARFLWYSVGSRGGSGCSIGEQMEALRFAMAVALSTNRTLILRRFIVVPEQHESCGAASVRPGTSSSSSFELVEYSMRVFTHLFEYAPFLKHFPQHRESIFLQQISSDGPPQPSALPTSASAAEQWSASTSKHLLLHVRYDLINSSKHEHFFSQQLESQLSDALRPAPELRVISEHILSRLRARVVVLVRSVAERR
ncbi:MAG: hypothetical protein SGPRY_004400 [Prymnesium sp.]